MLPENLFRMHNVLSDSRFFIHAFPENGFAWKYVLSENNSNKRIWEVVSDALDEKNQGWKYEKKEFLFFFQDNASSSIYLKNGVA